MTPTRTDDGPVSWPTTNGSVTTVTRVDIGAKGAHRWCWLVTDAHGCILTSSRTVFRRRHLAVRDARRFFPEAS